MNEAVTDKELVKRAQAGDDAAFGLLVQKYQYRLIKLTSRYVNAGDAPDIAQEAFIKAYRALNKFQGRSSFYTWLYRIAINTAKNHIVARARRPASQDIDVGEAEFLGYAQKLSHNNTPDALLESEQARDTVIHTIQSLPEDLRTAIMLREVEGFTYDEIAQAMSCPVGTVRSRIFRARAAIEKALDALETQ